MNLKILLPFRIFLQARDVAHIVAETGAGALGILPQRLDCVAALASGIFTYGTSAAGTAYVAVAAGILIKKGDEVIVSVRQAFAGVDLQELHAFVKRQLTTSDANDREARVAVSKMESAFVGRLAEFADGR